MATKIEEINIDRPIVDGDGSLTIQSRTFFRQLIDRALIIGTGSPEGVVPAEIGSSYMDDSGAAGSIMYLKRDDNITGDKSKGWILV